MVSLTCQLTDSKISLCLLQVARDQRDEVRQVWEAARRRQNEAMGVVQQAKLLQQETDQLRKEALKEREEMVQARIEMSREKAEAEEAKHKLMREVNEADEAEMKVREMKATAIWQSKFKGRHLQKKLEDQIILVDETADAVSEQRRLADEAEKSIYSLRAALEETKTMMESAVKSQVRLRIQKAQETRKNQKARLTQAKTDYKLATEALDAVRERTCSLLLAARCSLLAPAAYR